MDELFQEVLYRLKNGINIDEEMFLQIIDQVGDLCHNDLHNEKEYDSDHFERLYNTLNKKWAYKGINASSPEQSYLLGGIWGCLRLYHSLKEKEEIIKECLMLSKKYKEGSLFSVLDAIYHNPGIQDKELSGICKIPLTNIKEILTIVISEQLISCQTFGKEKGYYIRDKGERVYKNADITSPL